MIFPKKNTTWGIPFHYQTNHYKPNKTTIFPFIARICHYKPTILGPRASGTGAESLMAGPGSRASASFGGPSCDQEMVVL
jgi:hypothetical protein